MDCFVTCGFNHCDGVTIHGPTNGNLSVDCPGRCGCCYARIYGPTNGNLEVLCEAPDACGWAQIFAPTNGDFNLLCGGPANYGSCQHANYDASNMVTGSFNVQSTTSNPVQFSTFKCPGSPSECNILC
eukprot:850606_1